MPIASITSTKTGQTFDVDFTDQPTADDIDEVTSAWDTQFYQREGLDPSIAEQGVVGTAGNAFARDLGGTALDAVGGVAKGTAEMSRALGPMGNVLRFVPGVSTVMSLGDAGDAVAGFTDAVREESRAVYPVNPANPVAETIGGGAGQAVAMLGTMGAAAPVLGTGAALTVVPTVLSGAMGVGSGIDTAKELGIDNPAGRLALGAAFGGAEALTERLGGIGGTAAAEALQTGVKAGLKQAGKSVLSEAIEEPISGTLQDAATFTAGQFVADPKRPGYTVTGMKLPALDAEFMNRRKLEAIGGAAGGTVFAGLQLAASGKPAPATPTTPSPMPVSEDLGELTAEDVADLEPEGVGQALSDPPVRRVPILGDVPDRVQEVRQDNASVTKDSGPTADQTAQQAPGVGLSPATGALSPANPERIVATGKPNGAQVSVVIDYVEAADLEPLLLREVGEDQTRDRANNRASAEQIASIATSPDAQLLGDSPVSSLGAPVVDDVVLAGNGRAEGLLQGYRGGGSGIANYRAQVVQQAEAQGRPDVAGMKQPVMIRRVTNYVRGDRRSFVTESNPKYGALQETVAEASLLDAEVLGDMSGIEFTESGQLTSSSLQQVATKLKAAQRGVNATTGGKPDVVEASRRVQLASLAKLARDNGVDVAELSGLLETDTGRRTVAEVSKAAPRLAALDADLGLGDVLLSALRSFSEGARAVSQGVFKNLNAWAKNRGQELIRDELSPEAGQILEIMIETARTPTKLRELFDTYLEAATNEQNQRNQAAESADIFGDARSNVAGKTIVRRQMAGGADTTPATAEAGSGQGDGPLALPGRASSGVLGTVADGQVITVKVPNLEQANHANTREIASAGQEDGAKDFRYNPRTKTVYWGRLSAVTEAERQKVADWLSAEGQEVTGHKQTSGNEANYREAHGLAAAMQSPAELAANQKANEAILKSLGLPTTKGTRIWGAAKVKVALGKLSKDTRYPATTRLMAEVLSKLSLDNLLLKIEADARLNWAGLYQPFADGRGELSLNTRTVGRGEGDIGISLVHEVLHHATYNLLRRPKTAKQKQAAADLAALFQRAKAALASTDQMRAFDYELSNMDEFITGLFTRADFQTALAGIPAEMAPKTLGQRVRSVLDEIFRVLAELVTSKAVPPGSVLEASMAATLRLMEDGQSMAGMAGPALMNPSMKETKSRFARPEEQERLYQVREDVTVKAAAEAWVDSMPMEQAVAAMEAGRLPADMTGDVAQHAAGLLIQRTTEMMKSGSEVVQMQARSLGHRISKVWQGWLSQEAGRNLRQRAVVSSELTPYAPILAAEGMLIDRADAVMDQRFDGGATGGATKLNELVKKVDEQTSVEVSQAVEETLVNATPTDPVVAAAAIKAVTNAARAYFGGFLPPRVKILHQESAEWDARLNGEVLELNAAALETSQVIGKIEHEIGHLLFRDPSMQTYFSELWAGLDVNERAQIENITAALYDAQNRNEEASVRALDFVRQRMEAKNPSLWQRFVSWVQRAWERFTGRLPRDPRRLAAVMIETGVARLQGVAGNETAVRESRRSSLLKVNSPALVKALNALRAKMYPGVKWADVFMDLPASQKERQRAIYTRLQKDQALQALTQAERLTLTNELNKSWQQERRKVFLRELERVGIGEKAAADKAKVVKALPKLIRLINLGMMNSEMFREAVAPEYGLKQITTQQALALRKLAEEAYALPEGVLRSRKLAALLDGIQKSTGTGLPEVLNQYWVAAVLSGMRTQFDTFMSAGNGFGNQLIQSGMLALKNGNRAAAVVSMMEWWRGLKQAFPEAMQILAKGDYSYLKRFNEDLKKALEGESTFRPVPLGEALWRDGNAMEKYGFAPVMIWTGRLMAAADHLNNSATTAGAKVVARALHPELYKTVAASQSERDAAAAQARREVTGGAMPATAAERATVAARTREILNGQLRPEELKEASFMGDQAAYQNDPTGAFGGIYRAVNQGLGSLERGLQAYADEKSADGPAGRYARGLMLFLSGAMRSMMGAKFIRFGANFGNDMLGYVPGTVLLSPALLGTEATRSQRQLLMGKNVFSLMAGLTVAAMFLGKDDEEEGWHLEGPWTDLTPEEAKQRRAAGFEPLTFWKRTPDKVQRVSYKQWPTAGLLAGVAHMQDRQRFRPEKWAKEGMAGHLLAAASVGAFQVKDVSAMRGLADLLGASKFGTNPEDAFVEKLAKMPVNFAGGFIPTLVKDLDALADPRRYKPETVMEEFLRNVPVLRQRVAGGRPEINILGVPIEQDRKPWSRAYTDAESGPAHAVLGSLSARGFTLPTPETNRKVWKAGAWTTIAAMGADAEWRYQKKVGDGYRAWLGSPEGYALLTNPDGLAVQRLINRQAEAIKMRAVAEMVK